VDVGHRTEGAILYHLVCAGYSVLVPAGVNQRYDLVIDAEGEFIRAQCKTGRYRNGAIVFSTLSTITSKTRNVRREYHDQADVFLVHCPTFPDRVYCVPVDRASKGAMHLRVESSRNGQHQRVHWASEYQLPG
jgi:PD-(D/E)XK endonuclease